MTRPSKTLTSRPSWLTWSLLSRPRSPSRGPEATEIDAAEEVGGLGSVDGGDAVVAPEAHEAGDEVEESRANEGQVGLTTSAGSGALNVVLVHGAFVDGSSWRAVYQLLTEDGYGVAVVQNPTLSLSGDAAATRLVIDAQNGPVVLVGHSYGGAVITEAGTHDNVAALVYIAAFAPDRGESVKALGGDPDAAGSPIVAAPDGFYFQDREKFHASFGADLSAGDAVFLADSQVPWGADAMTGVVTEPAWCVKPSWYLVATEDRMITPPAQHAMAQRAGATTVEVTASHAVYMSQPRAVAAVIRKACDEVIAKPPPV
jgi:pimeloyl-ACP methyl ester carboxylesterase